MSNNISGHEPSNGCGRVAANRSKVTFADKSGPSLLCVDPAATSNRQGVNSLAVELTRSTDSNCIAEHEPSN